MLKLAPGNFISNTNLPNAPCNQPFPHLFSQNFLLDPRRSGSFPSPPSVPLQNEANKNLGQPPGGSLYAEILKNDGNTNLGQLPEENISTERNQTQEENMAQNDVFLQENEGSSDISFIDNEKFFLENIDLEVLENNNPPEKIGLDAIGNGSEKIFESPEKPIISPQKDSPNFSFLKTSEITSENFASTLSITRKSAEKRISKENKGVFKKSKHLCLRARKERSKEDVPKKRGDPFENIKIKGDHWREFRERNQKRFLQVNQWLREFSENNEMIYILKKQFQFYPWGFLGL